MKRRQFITLLGGAAAMSADLGPRVGRAQQPALPIVGILGAASPGPYAQYTAAVLQGLLDAGFVQGQNAVLEYRWAEGQYERLPALAAELVNRRVAVIVPMGGAPSTLAAKAATTAIPIVFTMGADPVQLGIVASFNRPDGNITGVTRMNVELEAKRLEFMRELVPTAALVAIIVKPDNPQAATQVRDVQQAARTVGQQLLVLRARTGREIVLAFDAMVEQRIGALLVAADTFFTSQPALFVALAARHAIPAIYPWREHVEQGGLMCYGANLAAAYREAGVYVGRVLKGTKPGDLPITQPTRFELVINMKTAKTLGLTVPLTLQVAADEVIE